MEKSSTDILSNLLPYRDGFNFNEEDSSVSVRNWNEQIPTDLMIVADKGLLNQISNIPEIISAMNEEILAFKTARLKMQKNKDTSSDTYKYLMKLDKCYAILQRYVESPAPLISKVEEKARESSESKVGSPKRIDLDVRADLHGTILDILWNPKGQDAVRISFVIGEKGDKTYKQTISLSLNQLIVAIQPVAMYMLRRFFSSMLFMEITSKEIMMDLIHDECLELDLILKKSEIKDFKQYRAALALIDRMINRTLTVEHIAAYEDAKLYFVMSEWTSNITQLSEALQQYFSIEGSVKKLTSYPFKPGASYGSGGIIDQRKTLRERSSSPGVKKK